MPVTANGHVSRAEFEQFERQVLSGFAENREAIAALGRKIDNVSTRGTDWRAILAAVSVVLTITGMLGGVVAYAITQQVAIVANAATENRSRFADMLGRISEQLHTEASLRDTHLREILDAHIGRTQIGVEAATKVTDRLAERLDMVERQLYAK